MNRNILTASIFIWIGFVLAISFMEAWLKFRAPGVTLSIGLGIGRLVFAALNKVELLLSALCTLMLLTSKTINSRTKILLFIPITIVLAQTIWMLPALDLRAELYLKGNAIPSSNMHLLYIIAEILKIAALSIAGVLIFKKPIEK